MSRKRAPSDPSYRLFINALREFLGLEPIAFESGAAKHRRRRA